MSYQTLKQTTMKTNIEEIKRLEKYGKSLIGKSAQSTVLTMISNCGQKKVAEPSQKITGYSIQSWCGEPELMVTMGGKEVFENTLFNIN